MPDITCVDRDGQSQPFCYEFEKSPLEDIWDFRVFAEPLPPKGEFFELSVSAVDSDTVRVISMSHHNEPAYVAKGIPEVLLPLVKATLGKEVVSSPTVGQAGVWRTPDATKVWERMRRRGLAEYDASADVYNVL